MLATLLATALLAPAPAPAPDKNALVVAQGEVPEARLIDVAIDVFAPGVSDTPASPLLEKYASRRRATSRHTCATRCNRRGSGAPCASCRAVRPGPSFS
jgi:hypothetical protein